MELLEVMMCFSTRISKPDIFAFLRRKVFDDESFFIYHSAAGDSIICVLNSMYQSYLSKSLLFEKVSITKEEAIRLKETSGWSATGNIEMAPWE